MSFQLQDGYLVRKDEDGVVRFADHSEQPYVVDSPPKGAGYPQLAKAYLNDVFNIDLGLIIISGAAPSGNYLQFTTEKTNLNVVTVTFEQRYETYGLFKAGAAVRFDARDQSILSGSNYFDYGNTSPSIDATALSNNQRDVDDDYIINILSAEGNLQRFSLILGFTITPSDINWIINKQEGILYKYDEDHRQSDHDHSHGSPPPVTELPELILDNVDSSINDGDVYLVNRVFFSTQLEFTTLHFNMMIEPETESVLYIRPHFHFMTPGFIYDIDPVTKVGNPLTPASPLADLNALRVPRPMPGLVTNAPQDLNGNYVFLTNIFTPNVAAPTTTGNFDYNVLTDDFTAVNAYYHSDFTFRMVEEMGFNMATYFDGTTFPVRVDHRGFFGCVNAAAPGNALGNGSDGYYYGLAQASTLLGIATTVRVVLHEFGHAALWDNVHSPNLGIAHSIGDSLATLYGAPGSNAPDKGLTFPWLDALNPGIGFDRRHDRPVATWAWGGSNDNGGYDSEQILSSSHYRAYRALGGDDPDLGEQQWASRYMMYLILHGAGSLTPASNPTAPEDWAAQLITCDNGTREFECHPGGLVHKVVRWGFEKQGAYKISPGPGLNTTPGDPPPIDLYINDGRFGEYNWIEDACQSEDIWNRLAADGNPAHQKPVPGQVNYAYVIVRNRGSQDSNFVTVRGHHHRRCKDNRCCDDIKKMIWPNDFKAMRTNYLIHGGIAAGSYAVVGPFEWIPDQGDCMMFQVDTLGDYSNIARFRPDQCVTIKRLVPFDNNVAIRDPWIECCC